jgi:hypothetical protein
LDRTAALRRQTREDGSGVTMKKIVLWKRDGTAGQSRELDAIIQRDFAASRARRFDKLIPKLTATMMTAARRGAGARRVFHTSSPAQADFAGSGVNREPDYRPAERETLHAGSGIFSCRAGFLNFSIFRAFC